VDPFNDVTISAVNHARNDITLPTGNQVSEGKVSRVGGSKAKVPTAEELQQVLSNDHWDQSYVDEFLLHTEQLRNRGISEQLQFKMTPTSWALNLENAKQNYKGKFCEATTRDDELSQYEWEQINKNAKQEYEFALDGNEGSYLMFDNEDPTGRKFGKLREKGGLTEQITKYIDENDGDSSLITSWLTGQAEGSWDPEAQAMKYFLATLRSIDPKESYYWGEENKGSPSDFEQAKQYYNKKASNSGGSDLNEKLRKTMAMWHAFINELLIHMEFPGKTDHGTVMVKRNEPFELMDKNNFQKNESPQEIPKKFRAVTDSYSLTRAPNVFNNVLTETEVPFHRILAVYFTTKPGKSDECALKADSENEFLVMGEGVPLIYRDPPPPKPKKEFSWF
jgi:hypothetical protein